MGPAWHFFAVFKADRGKRKKRHEPISWICCVNRTIISDCAVVPVYIALAFLVGKKFIKKSMSLKIIGGMVVFLVALPLPIADEIAGRMYFNHLCETEGGVKVYQTIELPAEYWDEEGGAEIFKTKCRS